MTTVQPLKLSGNEPHMHDIALVDVPAAGGEAALIALLASVLVRVCAQPVPHTLSMPPTTKQQSAA